MCLLAAFAQRASLTRDDYCALCEILTDKRFDPRDITTRTMQGLKYHVNSRLPQVRSRKVPLTLEQRVRVRQRTVPGKGRRRVKIKPTVKWVTKKSSFRYNSLVDTVKRLLNDPARQELMWDGLTPIDHLTVPCTEASQSPILNSPYVFSTLMHASHCR